MLLCPHGEGHHPIAPKSTTPLLRGTTQLSQNPFVLFLKPRRRHLIGSLGQVSPLAPSLWLGCGQGCFVQSELQGLSPVCGVLALRKWGRFGLVSWADTPKYVFYTCSLFSLLFKKKKENLQKKRSRRGGHNSQKSMARL